MAAYMNGKKIKGAYMNGHKVNAYINGKKLFNDNNHSNK